MAVSRQATIKIPVKVNQTAIDKANKAITKMTGSGGSLQKAMDKLNGQFDKLDKTINNFSKNYKNGLDGVIESNKQAIKSNKKLTDQTVAGHKQVQKSLQKLADDDKKFTDSSSKHAQQHTRNMNSVARSYDHATSRIDRMNKAADKAINVGRSMSLTTLGLGASLVKGSNDAMNLQHQYKVIQNLAVYGGEKQAEAQKNVNEMRKQGEKYSLQYGVSQKKLSAGYEELTRRGYDTNQSLATQKQFLQASLASGDDYSNVVTGAAGALEAFGLKSKNTNQMTYNTKKVLNQLSYAADLTATDFNGMNDAMKYTGSAAHSAKQSIGETSSALGVLSNSNIDASIAGTSLRQILDRLVAPPKKGKAVTAMQQLGLTAQDFRDGKGNLLSLQDVFSKLNDHMKGMNPTNRGAIFNALFGQTAQNSATILSEHVKDLKGLNKQVQNAQNMHGGKGYIAELSAKNIDTAKVQTQKFQAALSDLNITFANELLPNITGLTKGMINMIAKLADSPSWFKKLIAYGGVFVAGIAPVTLVFGGIAKAIKGVATSLGWVRKQFQTPMSNTMTNSMVRQSGKMQTGNFISRNTVTGKMANRASKNKAFSTAFDLKDSSVGSNFSKSSLGTMKSKPSNGMFRAPTEIGTAGKYSSLRNFGNKLRPSSIGRGIATSRLGRGTSFLSSKLGIASLLGKIPNPKNGIKAIGSGTKSIGKKVVGSRFVPQILKNGAVPKAGSKLLGGAKEIGSKIPYLDVAMAGTQLIGMNKKNAGGKIGSAGGMLAGTAGGAATGAAIGSVIPGLGTGIGGLIGGAAGGIGGSSIGKKIGQTIQKSLPKGVFNPIVKQWNRFKKWIGKSTKQVVKPFKSLFRGMKKLFKPVTDGWNSFQKALNTKKGQSNIKKLSKVFNFAMKPLKGLFSGVKIAFKVSMSAIKATARGIGSFLYTLFKGVFKTVGGIFKVGADLISGKWSNLGKDLKSIGSGIWDVIRSPFAGIGKFFASIWGDVQHQFSQGFKWLKGIVAGGINDLFGIINAGSSLINKVLSYVGGSGHTIGTLKPVHFATGTRRKTINRPTYSMLNDGNDSPETGNKEMAILPTGHAFMPKQRNWRGILPAGTEVMNAKETKSIMNMNGIEHFAGGTGFFGNMLNGAKNMAGSATHAVASGVGHAIHGTENIGGKALHGVEHLGSSVWNKTKSAAGWAWNKAKDVGSAIAHPIRTIMNAFGKLPKLPPFLTDFGNGVLDKVKTMAVDFFKQNGGGSANPGGAGVQRWKPDVAKALRMLNLSTSGGMINKVLTQINTESGGNPNAVGGTDGLSDGRAMGLMQVKPGTFSAYSKPGLGGWSNGFASIFSGLNYAKHRYGPDLSFLGQGHGYANGGWANKPGIFGEVPGQPEVAINPKRPSSDRLIGEAINARAKADSRSPFARWSSSQKSKKQRDTLIAKRDAIFDKKQTKPVQPNVNMEVNITINGNADQGALQQTTNNFRRIVREEMQKMAFNQLQKG